MAHNIPLGSKDPNNRALGPKYYSINGIWALKPYYLGPWTLRTCFATVHAVLAARSYCSREGRGHLRYP